MEVLRLVLPPKNCVHQEGTVGAVVHMRAVQGVALISCVRLSQDRGIMGHVVQHKVAVVQAEGDCGWFSRSR